MQGGGPLVRVQGVRVMRHGGRHGGSLPLGGASAEVGNQAHAQRVTGVQALHRAEVPGRFRQTLPEPDAHEIHGEGVDIEVACGRETRR